MAAAETPDVAPTDSPAAAPAGDEDPGGAPEEAGEFTRMYKAVMAVSRPLISGWGRMRVTGREFLPASGPLLIAGNHDSYYDTVAVGVAARPVRQIRALAKDSLWGTPGLGPVLTGMGQIPIKRDSSDAVAFERAVTELRAGACIGIFPEGTRSLGRELRARSGIGRLAQFVPEATVVLVAIHGTTEFVRFPRRPAVTVEFFMPESGQPRQDEAPGAMAQRFLDEIRARSAPVNTGRRTT